MPLHTPELTLQEPQFNKLQSLLLLQLAVLQKSEVPWRFTLIIVSREITRRVGEVAYGEERVVGAYDTSGDAGDAQGKGLEGED